jgi:hypothetical protein
VVVKVGKGAGATLPFLESAPRVPVLRAAAFGLVLLGIVLFGILVIINMLFLRK